MSLFNPSELSVNFLTTNFSNQGWKWKKYRLNQFRTSLENFEIRRREEVLVNIKVQLILKARVSNVSWHDIWTVSVDSDCQPVGNISLFLDKLRKFISSRVKLNNFMLVLPC